jgi:hypothetical protein
MRLAVTVWIICLISFAASPARANPRSASLINSFEVLCNLELPNMARIAEKAKAMRLRAGPPTNNGPVHAQTWVVPLTTGPHILIASEADGARGHVTTCGIHASDADGADFARELVATLKLGAPQKETTSADGQTENRMWRMNGSDDLMLALGERSRVHAAGIDLVLMYRRKPKS